MTLRSTLAALGLALIAAYLVHRAAGEWVQVPVIDRGQGQGIGQGIGQGLDGKKQAPQPASGPPLTTPPPSAPAGAPGLGSEDVITIRRTVADSFSNKASAVPVPGSHDAPGAPDVHQDADEDVAEEVPDDKEEPALPLWELREAHQTLLKQSTAPISGKLDFLRRLKNRLLRHIASLIPQSARSLAGGDVQEGRGHKGVGFPSNESTLMSLAFLVFAVFLVKVVMQLIYAVQNHQNVNANAGLRVAQMQIPEPMVPMNMVPAMMPAGMPPMMAAMDAGGARGRERRHAEALDKMTTNVLTAIHKARARLGDLRLGAPSG